MAKKKDEELKKPQSIEHIPMCCPLCKKRFLNFAGQPLENHAQVRATLSTGDTMDLAICTECLPQATPEILDQVMAGVQDYWDWQIDTDKTKKSEQKSREKAWHNAYRVNGIDIIIRTAEEHKFDELQKQLDEAKHKEEKANEKAKKK